jgi:trk system potassium uptake protein TrkH
MEVPGPTKDTVAPRIKETASILWKLYIFLTFLQIILLIWTNDKMTLYDACCITFSTLSGGGFSVKNASIGAYNNAYTDWVVICFMIAGGINFALYFHIMKRRFYRIFDPDLMLYLFILLFGSLLVSSFLIGKPYINLDNTEGVYSIGKAIRYGFFQAISAQTSTGFATTNYDIWPFPPQMFMLLLMYIGGMSGSTAGGIKTSRYLIAFKVITHKIKAICHPEEVSKIRIQNSEITTPVSVMVLVFFSIAIFFAVLGMALLVLLGIDPETAIGAIACLMNNIGMAFRAAGPANSFAFFPNSAKIVSIIWMLLGRLEFFAVILVLIPSFWKKNK